MSYLLHDTVCLRKELSETKKVMKHAVDFNAKFLAAEIRKRFCDLDKLEKMVDEFSSLAGSFNMEVADHLTNPPSPDNKINVLNVYFDLSYKACDLIYTHDIQKYKSIPEIFAELASDYNLQPDHAKFLYENGIEAACKDLIQAYDKSCEIHETVHSYISGVLSSLDILKECVETSLNALVKGSLLGGRRFKQYYILPITISDLDDLNDWQVKVAFSQNIEIFKRPKKIIFPITVKKAFVLKPLWNIGYELQVKMQKDFVCPIPLKKLIDEGYANFSQTLFLIGKR